MIAFLTVELVNEKVIADNVCSYLGRMAIFQQNLATKFSKLWSSNQYVRKITDFVLFSNSYISRPLELIFNKPKIIVNQKIHLKTHYKFKSIPKTYSGFFNRQTKYCRLWWLWWKFLKL